MKIAVLNSMTAAEQRLVAETSAEAMASLDEEELLALHTRIRRARSKYVSVYRRGAAGTVEKRGGRGFAYPENQRDRDKAEVFESALARVSRAVGVVAARAAAELRETRLAAARPTGSGPAVAAGTAKAAGAAGKGRPVRKPGAARARKTTGGLKRDASSKAQGARRQARRDTGGS